MSWLSKKVDSSRLSVILGVFEVAVGQLEDFLEGNQKELDRLNDELIVRTRDHSKAKGALTQIKKITGEG
jgi:hypothetical protein